MSAPPPPASERGPSPSESELTGAREREAELRAQLEVVRASLHELQAELGQELAAWSRAEGLLEGRELVRELRRARGQLAALKASRAWRLGQALLEPARRARDVARRLEAWWHPAPLDPPRTPLPFDKYRALGAYHWEYLATKPWYRQRVQALTDWVEPEWRCLDLGCGDAAVAARVAERCREVVGVDRDPDALRLAREALASREVANVRLVEADLHRPPEELQRGDYDLVYALDLIEHLDPPEPLLDLMQRALRPGGLAVVGTPLWVGEAAVSPHHVRELTLAQLDGLLLPRFRKLGAARLPAPRPDRKGELSPRYCLWLGRRRGRSTWWT